MNQDRWKKIDEIYQSTLEQPEEKHAAFLTQACGEDEDLHREVEEMLKARKVAGSFLEQPAAEQMGLAHNRKPDGSLTGRRIGPYEVVRLLGRGGMGEVYKARDTRLDRIGALKILPIEVAADPDRLRRFIREAKAASALNHSNIATIYEIGESDGIQWIAMELVEGQTLAERLKGTPLEFSEILDIGIQVAEALEEAHNKGIIHRDIKPANLMLTPKGQVKILDFGLAKMERREGFVSAAETSETHTLPGLVMGTARYMSPEQVLGQAADHRSDIFSLGVVLYEMATGQPPFAGDTPSAIFEAIVHQTPVWPRRAHTAAPAELQRIINKALEKFREMRYPSALNLCGEEEIWEMPAYGGEAVRITRNGGDVPQESPDGKTIYYMKGYHQNIPSVWRMPVEGGEEIQVLDSVHRDGQWTVANDGIYYFIKPDDRGHSDLCLYEFATSKIRKILIIERLVDNIIAVSPDSKTILYAQVNGEGKSDLKLVENFR